MPQRAREVTNRLHERKMGLSLYGLLVWLGKTQERQNHESCPSNSRMPRRSGRSPVGPYPPGRQHNNNTETAICNNRTSSTTRKGGEPLRQKKQNANSMKTQPDGNQICSNTLTPWVGHTRRLSPGQMKAAIDSARPVVVSRGVQRTRGCNANAQL